MRETIVVVAACLLAVGLVPTAGAVVDDTGVVSDAAAGNASANATGVGADATLSVGSTTAPVGETGTVVVTVSGDRGLSGTRLTVVADGDAARIVGASYSPRIAPVEEPVVADDGSSVTLRAVDGGGAVQPGDGGQVATVSFDAVAVGRTTLTVAVDRFEGEAGDDAAPTVRTGTVTVPPSRVDGVRPTDPDGDGVYEDLNGNDRVDYDDVVRLFRHPDAPAVTDAPGTYDVNGNGRADYDDVVELFAEVVAA